VWAEAKALCEDGWRVTVLSPRLAGAPWRERLDGITVFRYPTLAADSARMGHVVEYAVAVTSASILAVGIHLRCRVDILHVANPPDFFWPLARLMARLGATFIFDQHDPVPELYLAQGGRPGGLVYRFLRWSEHQTHRAASVVVATNESVRGLVVGRGQVDPERVVVVRSSIDPSRTFRVEPDVTLRAGRRFLVVYLGVMGPQDGIDLFVRAARSIANELPGEVRFVAIGDGSERPRARRMAAELGLDAEVDFPGRLSDDLVRSVLSTADLAIGPDPKNGFNELCTMNKTLEYMAMGLPVVSFDLTETRVSAGEAGVYAVPNDPADLARRAVEVLTSPDRGQALGAAGRTRVEGPLSWENSRSELLRAYALARRLGGGDHAD
jgi:glycosyltransferase involved in cell wall biosynthesis